MSLEPGRVVVVYLREPREQVVGVLRSLDAAGVTVSGIGLDAFDDWSRMIARRESAGMGPVVAFYPLLRVEKIYLDAREGDLPSFADRFQERTREELTSWLDGGGQAR